MASNKQELFYSTETFFLFTFFASSITTERPVPPEATIILEENLFPEANPVPAENPPLGGRLVPEEVRTTEAYPILQTQRKPETPDKPRPLLQPKNAEPLPNEPCCSKSL
ncbi:hypothetical protein AVEN_184115-1 [Araneus ventricosus]|uniref:Uncharacterized protein n=1 Tax=Araneus ventricosus TaxID=182803 RepID=A0A4Y2CZ88_ARAVE|nr:hypothetical protein AVEN_184115-1 [Araneus ventricosus]